MAGTVLAAASGRWDWLSAWLLVGVYGATFAVQAAVLIPRSPGLLAERSSRMDRSTKPWDKIILPIYGLATLSILVVAGLDLRFGWGNHLSPGLQVAGLVLSLLGNGLVTWAMAANDFFAFSVRLQPERDQSVATGGPYRAVRHPGYAGAAVFALGSALLLGSTWALLPAVLAVTVLVIRTALEDRTLRAELAGYADFARNTRSRLIPGVW
jgi:protein-S-isoprenylcysteine O-methyltransferase Ste14